MTTTVLDPQYIRKASLLVLKPEVVGDSQASNILGQVLDLSKMHFQFKTANQDEEGPNNCTVRVFNLARNTVETLIKYNFSRVVLQAGYDGSFGVIFDGSIKQFRVGKINATDTYLDILAADGDLGYNFAPINVTLAAAQTNRNNIINQAAQAFKDYGVVLGQNLADTGGVLPRGKVMFGMARTFMTSAVASVGSTWSIQNGQIQVIPLDGYLPGDAVKLSSATGLIGIPEQTQDGIKCRCLLNPKIVVGGRIQIDQASINQTIAQTPLGHVNPGFTGGGSQLSFNKWSTVQNFASIATDGFYRVYMAEHDGDTRGQAWYTDIIALAIDNSTQKVKPYGG